MKRKAFYAMSLSLLAALVLPSCAQEDNRITLIYRSWDTGTSADHNEERQLIEAFEKKENVKIKVVEDPGSGASYDPNIKASYFTNIDCADVLMTNSIAFGLENEFFLNIKEFVEADEEFANIPASVRDAVKFKSGYYGLPCRLNLQGYFANLTVIEALGIDTENLSVNSSYADLEAIINAAANSTEYVGLNSPAHFIETMASVLDTSSEKKLGYYTWDGEKYNLNSDAFISAVQKGREMYDSHLTLDSYTEEERINLGVSEEAAGDAESAKVDAWNKGILALRYGATYEMKDMINNMSMTSSYRFIGNPGGKISIVGDFYGISVTTKYPELSYKFAKWMSFGKEGFMKRMDIYHENHSLINSMPLQNDTEIINRYFDLFGSDASMSGIEDAYNYIRTKSMVEGVKVVPAYGASRWNAETGVALGDGTMGALLNACIVGGQDITLYTSGTTNINTIANQQYTNWMNKNGGKYQ